MDLVLTVTSGPREGAVLRASVPGAVGIGRGPSSDLHVVDVTMSRLHAVVTWRDGAWWVDDQDSRNGMWLAGTRVRRHRIADGDVVRFGKITEVRFTYASETRGGSPGPPDAGPPAAAAETEPVDPEQLVGVVVERYRVLAPLPRCGPGTRLRARDENYSRDVTLRVFGPPDTESPEFAEAFEREVRIASRLVHPHVVPVLDRGEHRGLLFVVEDAGTGVALWDLLDERRFVPPQDAAKVALHVLSALVYVVGESVALPHLSATAVLVNDAYDARIVRLSNPSRAHATPSVGEAGMIAPEVALGRAWRSERALVYCVGALLYRMLCGIPPHDGATTVEAAARAMRAAPTPIRRVNLKVSPALERVVHDALDSDPEGRIPSLSEFREMLRRAGHVGD